MYSVDCEFTVLEATEVDAEELIFQSLLQEYELPDNVKTRKLWEKFSDPNRSKQLHNIN
jgi:hypothetical protein